MTNRKSVFGVLAGAAFMSLAAGAAEIKGGRFDAKSSSIELDLAYAGECQGHQFTLSLGKCQDTVPVQCPTVKLIDKVTQPSCETASVPVQKKVRFTRAELEIDDNYFDEAKFTVLGDNGTQVNIVVGVQ